MLQWTIIGGFKRPFEPVKLRLRERNGLFQHQPANTFTAGWRSQGTAEAIAVQVFGEEIAQIYLPINGYLLVFIFSA